MYSLCSVRLFSIICHFFYFFTRQMSFHTEILQIHRNGITKHFVNIFFKNTWFWTSIDQRYNVDLSRDSKITITQIQYRIYWSSFSKYALLNIRNSFWRIFFGNTTPINPIFSSIMDHYFLSTFSPTGDPKSLVFVAKLPPSDDKKKMIIHLDLCRYKIH